MSVNSPKINRLEILRTEISHIIIDLLMPWEIKPLSRVSKQPREACLPSLLHRVKFQFAEAGFVGLKNLMKSDARYHVVFFMYSVPELLKTGKHISTGGGELC